MAKIAQISTNCWHERITMWLLFIRIASLRTEHVFAFSPSKFNSRTVPTTFDKYIHFKQPRMKYFYLSSNNSDDVGEGNTSSNMSNNHNSDPNKITPLDRAMQKARARAEIERLTKGSDAVYDREDELKKLIGGISPGLNYELPDSVTDLEHYTLESKLSKAIEKGDFQLASKIRELLDRMHIDDCGYVLQLNSAFYKAFSDKDFDGMKELWIDDNTVQCIHPSNPPVVGYIPIIESWKKLFQESDDDSNGFHMNTIHPTNIRLSVKGATAWITCDEEVFMPKFVRGIGKKKELIKKFTATNIFRKVNGKWSIAHHHSTAHVDFDQGNKGKKSINGKPAIQSTTISLGGQILGSPSLSSDSGDNSNGPVKRVFMGSISDLLNGGLGDLLSDDDGMGGDNDNKDGIGKTIIRVNSNFDDDDDDEDDDEEDDNSNTRLSSDGITDLSDLSSLSQSKQQMGIPKDALRQNCITALRKLANQVQMLINFITCIIILVHLNTVLIN